MPELKFDQPVLALSENEDSETLAAIDKAIAQMDAAQGIPIEELRREFEKRCQALK